MIKKDLKILEALRRGTLSVNANTGEVFSNRGQGGNKCTPKLVSGISTNGYVRGAVRINGVHVSYRCHRVVWISVNGTPPKGLFVLHKDNCKTNNKISNLELGDATKNIRDAFRDGLLPRGQNRVQAKLKDSDVVRIRALREAGIPRVYIQKLFGISGAVVTNVANRTIWKHVK